MLGKIKLHFSAWALVLVAIIWFSEVLTNPKHKNAAVIEWDVQEYYMYVPAVFIYHDLDFGFVKNLPPDLQRHFWTSKSPTGKEIGRMSLGMAIAYIPFFALAHLGAKLFHYSADGYSAPYQFMILLSGFAYAFMGLVFLRKILKRHFSEAVTAITLGTLAIGTNLFYYVTTEGAMTHATLFGLFAVFFFYTVRWYEAQRLKYILFAAFAVGLAALIRPTAILVLVIFFLYGITNRYSLVLRLKLLKQYFPHLLAAAGLLLLIAFPQLLYWKMQTGSWVFYSYGDQHFFFSHPHIYDGLLSYRKGWLIYTPVMILSLLGFGVTYRYARDMFWPILVFTVLNIFIVFSWWCWWYGGSFGMRALIESYVFLAVPLASVWAWLWSRPFLISTVSIFTLMAIGLNLYQTKQYRAAIIHWDSMTEKAYWHAFLRMEYPPQDMLQTPDYEGAMKGRERSPEEIKQSQPEQK